MDNVRISVDARDAEEIRALVKMGHERICLFLDTPGAKSHEDYLPTGFELPIAKRLRHHAPYYMELLSCAPGTTITMDARHEMFEIMATVHHGLQRISLLLDNIPFLGYQKSERDAFRVLEDAGNQHFEAMCALLDEVACMARHEFCHINYRLADNTLRSWSDRSNTEFDESGAFDIESVKGVCPVSDDTGVARTVLSNYLNAALLAAIPVKMEPAEKRPSAYGSEDDTNTWRVAVHHFNKHFARYSAYRMKMLHKYRLQSTGLDEVEPDPFSGLAKLTISMGLEWEHESSTNPYPKPGFTSFSVPDYGLEMPLPIARGQSGGFFLRHCVLCMLPGFVIIAMAAAEVINPLAWIVGALAICASAVYLARLASSLAIIADQAKNDMTSKLEDSSRASETLVYWRRWLAAGWPIRRRDLKAFEKVSAVEYQAKTTGIVRIIKVVKDKKQVIVRSIKRS